MPHDLMVHMVEYLSATICQIDADDPDEQEGSSALPFAPTAAASARTMSVSRIPPPNDSSVT